MAIMNNRHSSAADEPASMARNHRLAIYLGLGVLVLYVYFIAIHV